MKKRNILLLSAAACVIAGLILAATGWIAGGGNGFYIDRTGTHVYGTEPMQEGKKRLDKFQNIELDLPGVTVTFTASDHYGIEYSLSPSIKIKQMESLDGTLYVKSDSSHFFRLNFFSTQIQESTVQIFYPVGLQFNRITANISTGSINGSEIHAETVDLRLSSGNLSMEKLSAGEIKIGITSGAVKLSDTKAKDISITNSSGKVELSNGEFSGTMTVKSTSGNIALEGVFAEEMVLGITSGDIKLLDCRTEELFSEQSSGNLYADRMETDGITCRITSGKAVISGSLRGKNKISVTSGNIECTTDRPESEYSYTVKKTSGNFRVNGEKAESSINSGSQNTFQIDMTSGNVSLNFDAEE